MSPDKTDPGYNIIFCGYDQTRGSLVEAGEFLKLTTGTLEKLIATNHPLPVARTLTSEEAQLVREKLTTFGVEAIVLSDEELGVTDNSIARVRSVIFEETAISFRASGRPAPIRVNFADLMLMVQARLLTRITAVKERQTRSSENEILDASEFFADEAVYDLYCAVHSETLRISANNFDFSCLGPRKALVVSANMSTLAYTLASKAPQLEVDNSYVAVRQLLDVVWGSEKATRSEGWRREAPGRVTVAATTTDTNEKQFTRYSRLKFHLRQQRV